MSRDAEISAFLAASGFGRAAAEPLAQDASFRRYLRITGGPRPAVLMDAPPPEDIAAFVRIAAHLAACGLSVPDILGVDLAAGLLLEEDLGDDLFPAVAQWEPMLDAAVDTLVAMQRAAPPTGLPEWGAAQMSAAAQGTLLDWWWPAMFGGAAPEAARRDFAGALDRMLAPVAAGPVGFVHRDFFAGNLIWLPQRPGARRVGVIDFQGAALGHPAYDLVSLVQDARRAFPPGVAERAVARYVQARPELDPVAFDAAFIACAAQRHLRVAAQWVRLARRDGRPGYLAYGPHTWHLLGEALKHPAAAPLAAAMDRWIPPDRRRNPPEAAA
jgi:aminoglycoside/choline kinase family phosphotransferase